MLVFAVIGEVRTDDGVDNDRRLIWVRQFQGDADQIGVRHNFDHEFLTKAGLRIVQLLDRVSD